MISCELPGFENPKGLSTEERVTLVIIRRFLDFKEGEVWAEVSSELAQENLRPITPDQVTYASTSCDFNNF